MSSVNTFASKYKEKLAKWDEVAKVLPKDQKKEYKRLRKAFVSRMQTWEAAAERDLEILEVNMKEAFTELETTWLHLTKK